MEDRQTDGQRTGKQMEDRQTDGGQGDRGQGEVAVVTIHAFETVLNLRTYSLPSPPTNCAPWGH